MNYATRYIRKIHWDLRHTLIEQGVSSTTRRLEDRPHVSLAVFPNVNCDDLISVTKDYANVIKSFDFQLSTIGSFPTNEMSYFYH